MIALSSLFRRERAPDPAALSAALAGQADAAGLLVLVLARHLQKPVDPGRALSLLATADVAEAGQAARIGALAREARHGVTAAARLARAARLLAAQMERNRRDPRGWSRADIQALFDPAGLRLACAHDPLLAALADRVTRDGLARLGEAGLDPALLGLGMLGVGRGSAPAATAWDRRVPAARAR